MHSTQTMFPAETVAAAITAFHLRGDGSGPAAYLQAGLHADEIPGMLVLHRLLPLLAGAEQAGRLRGDITVVPQANPLGLAQFRHGRLLGRFEASSGRNFNRGFHTLPETPGIGAWQAALSRLVGDAAIVLDLHTDDEALPYLYLHAPLWPAATDLATAIGARVAILWEGDGGGAFEDVFARGGPAGRLTATVELRGQADVDAATAAADADGLFRLLCARGVIDGDAALPEWDGLAVPIGQVHNVYAPVTGVLAYTARLGEAVAEGAPLALLVPAPGQPGQDIVLRARAAGLLLTRHRDRYVAAGTVVAKLATGTPDPDYAGGVLDP